MFIRLVICVVSLLFFVVTTVHAVTMQETKNIYKQLVLVNHIKAPPLFIVYSTEINASTTQDSIIMYTGLMKITTKAEMALTLGHELTHWVNHDVHYGWFNPMMREMRADMFGSKYAENIGYSRCGQASLFLKFYHMWGDSGGSVHPANTLRYQRLHRGCK